jgi:hypothetical protein
VGGAFFRDAGGAFFAVGAGLVFFAGAFGGSFLMVAGAVALVAVFGEGVLSLAAGRAKAAGLAAAFGRCFFAMGLVVFFLLMVVMYGLLC